MRITDTIVIDERDLEERFVRASGPGGQNVNKVSSAVELRFNVQQSNLPDDVKVRLAEIAGSRMTVDGRLAIDAREERSQSGNREAARARLRELILRASRRPKSRRATKPSKASKVRRLEGKRRHGDKKKQRSDRRAED